MKQAAEPGLRPTKLRARHLLVTLLLLLAVVLGAILLGAIDLGAGRVLGEIWAQLTGGVSPLSAQEAAILWEIRVPRVMLGCLVGAALAGAGAAYQGVFANPLADPYLLGAAAGAGLTATVAVVAGADTSGGLVPIVAFAGAIGGVVLTWTLGRAAGRGTMTLLLAGVVISAFLTAVQTFVQQLDTTTISKLYSWMLGGLGSPGWSQILSVLPYIVLAGIVLCCCARLLDVLTLGDEEAAALGIRPGLVRMLVLGAACLATAAAVSMSGLIGFVGIVVPHAIRLLVGASHRILIPLSLLGGAAFLVAADVAARTVLAPAELPLGVVTACVGAPFFLVILRKGARNGRA
ncbi:FecCD family ABC transporter permease [Sciscionella sediminilitoris]|uniref:FecCD family ABC transporter permease n=1 Tax=Sciscionella sediminilitoris TaxID=1445613 RepID=UPI0004DF5AC8|nr:iron ABC transporter permease [Sciscionella sp. SE31]